MPEPDPRKPAQNLPPPPPPSAPQIGPQNARPHFPNRPETTNPDPATLRDQWRYAIRQYSKWYSHAWGTAILAGLSFFALGWVIKGSNPLPSFQSGPAPPSNDQNNQKNHDGDGS